MSGRVMWPNSEPVTVLHRVRDEYGDLTQTGQDTVNMLLAPRPLADAEEAAVGRNVLTVDLVGYAPGPSPIGPLDIIRRTRFGTEDYEVVGQPGRWQHPRTRKPDMLEVKLKKVTG